MRTKTSQKLGSTDLQNSKAHLKHTITADVVPFLRDDLVLVFKSAKGTPLAGRLALVERVTSLIRLLDASPQRSTPAATTSFASIEDAPSDLLTELSAETYYRSEKDFRVLLRSPRLTRFVVLDVELIGDDHHHHHHHDDSDGNPALYQGPSSGISKYALADVVVARASDFGVNDRVTSVVTHLGHLLQAGDSVLGYDLETAVGGDWELQDRLPSSYVIPEVVLVKKVKDSTKKEQFVERRSTENAAPVEQQEDEDDTAAATGKRISKKKQRKRKKQGKKMRELEESALRMGFLDDDDDDDDNFDEATTGFDDHLQQDPGLAEELAHLEETFAALETNKGTTSTAKDAEPNNP